jgi:4-amino-4-deoxy-L-arabinose transferase-like glycosyltransferase
VLESHAVYRGRALTPSLFLAAVLVLAAGARMIAIESVPPGFWFDESAVAVNAALIAEAGVDQYGEPWPLFFRALDDYKEPLFLYSVALSVRLLGRSVASARLPAALWGVLGVLVAYFLGREVIGSGAGGTWTAAFVAVTPWHIHFSRWSEQAIVLTVVYSAAVLFMIRLVRRRTAADGVAAGLFLAAGFYAYSPAKLLVAASLAAFLLFAWRRRFVASTAFAAFLAAFTLAALPFVAFYVSTADSLNLRFERIRIPWTEAPAAYLSHLDPRFAFGRGDADIRLATRSAMLPWYLAPLAAAGAFAALRRRSAAGLAMAGILAFTPVLGSLTHGYPHATRTLTALPFVQVLAALGLLQLLDRMATLRARRAAAAAAAVLVAAGFVVFSRHYWDVYRYRSRPEWNHGLIPALETAAEMAAADGAIYAPPAHYSDWMFAARTRADSLIARRAELGAGRDRYDPRDLAGKYAFLLPRGAIGRRARQAWDPARPAPGIWVVAMDDRPPGFTAPCEQRHGRFCVARVR